MLMHAAAWGGFMNKKKSVLKVESRRKIPCCTGGVELAHDLMLNGVASLPLSTLQLQGLLHHLTFTPFNMGQTFAQKWNLGQNLLHLHSTHQWRNPQPILRKFTCHSLKLNPERPQGSSPDTKENIGTTDFHNTDILFRLQLSNLVQKLKVLQAWRVLSQVWPCIRTWMELSQVWPCIHGWHVALTQVWPCLHRWHYLKFVFVFMDAALKSDLVYMGGTIASQTSYTWVALP